MKSEIKNGILKTYWRNSNKLKSEITYKNGMFHGPAKYFTNAGWLHSETLYQDDEITQVTIYYDNGQVKLDEHFQDGERQSISQSYDRNGNLLVEDIYENNRLTERRIFRLGITTF